MTIVKNISRGPRGFHLADGTFLQLESGQTSDEVKISDGELKSAKSTGAFQFDDEIDDDTDVAAQTAELSAATAEELDRRWQQLSDQIDAEKARADDAEHKLDAALTEAVELKAKLAKFDPDGNGAPGGAVGGEPVADDKVKEVLALLDPSKDDDWTQTGLPAVEAVAKLAGGKVTRDQITNAAPALSRETAK